MQRKRFSWRKFGERLAWLVGLVLWAYVSNYLAAYPVAFIFGLFVDAGTLYESAPLMAAYLTIIYILQIALVILVPWGISRLVRRRRAAQATHESNPAQADSPLMPTRQRLGFGGWPKWSDLGLAPAALIICLIVAGVLLSLFANIPGFDASAEQNLGFDPYLMHWDLLAAFVALVIMPPIAEETIYRGWLYGMLRSRWGWLVSSLVVSLLFGFLHGQPNAMVVAFVLGFLACGLRELTGNVYASIFMHMLKNGLAFWLVYIVHLG